MTRDGAAMTTETPVPVKRPSIARAPKPLSKLGVGALMLVGGAGVFLWLSEARADQVALAAALPPVGAGGVTAVQPLPLPPAGSPPVAYVQPPFQPAPAAPYIAAPISRPPVFVDNGARERAEARLRAPALIVDLAQSSASAAAAPLPDLPGGVAPPPAANAALNNAERFSARIGAERVEVSQAQRMTGLDRLVPQGAIIGAVMETALNSDLPGFARAIVQRDVLSFDGSAVLIPAGSRIIGQYQSGVARGASRVFIIWTRLIRPDGVTVTLSSPAIDEIGRGGVAGKVNRHFLQRYGGAILLSVLTGGLNIAAASVSGGGGTVVVGTAGEASALAQQAAADLDIPPTITTKQGALVRIFVAQDLDFTSVGPVASR
ncbi:type VI secretion protein [Polymorphobacter glacialis]|uniref:Type VI secretion protein n=1 Tax=Sandarakinorhabdus glacialis TaxID=1614636 RepID=A0A917E5L0_9SPHN|nr:TrbI/VirB10 family protein [Polymorphobacter glacialis]GGE02908.1 type VI secretion protein [Polymorphobacter glacialis]